MSEQSGIAAQPVFGQATDSPRIYVIHENDEWVEPLFNQFDQLEIPYTDCFLKNAPLDLTGIPPAGVFYSRMSASSHTRGHSYAIDLSRNLLKWLESNGRKVVNGSGCLELELSKVYQYAALNAHGIQTPQTVVVKGLSGLESAVDKFDKPLILKPNRGGKGLGVQLFQSKEELGAALGAGTLESVDGVFLVQEYIKAPDPEIVRMEFIGGRFYYAVRVDTSEGFELCPADACDLTGQQVRPKFEIIEDYDNPDLPIIESFLSKNHIDIAGMEYITDQDGRKFVYDINMTTNYNRQAEQRNPEGKNAAKAVAEFLAGELQKV